MNQKLISLVLPAYREEKNISYIYPALKTILSQIEEKYDYEIIFIND
jgi:glycosyltransferase involved in cell wall biosynthesis